MFEQETRSQWKTTSSSRYWFFLIKEKNEPANIFSINKFEQWGPHPTPDEAKPYKPCRLSGLGLINSCPFKLEREITPLKISVCGLLLSTRKSEWVCVYVCVCERERERERWRHLLMTERTISQPPTLTMFLLFFRIGPHVFSFLSLRLPPLSLSVFLSSSQSLNTSIS